MCEQRGGVSFECCLRGERRSGEAGVGGAVTSSRGKSRRTEGLAAEGSATAAAAGTAAPATPEGVASVEEAWGAAAEEADLATAAAGVPATAAAGVSATAAAAGRAAGRQGAGARRPEKEEETREVAGTRGRLQPRLPCSPSAEERFEMRTAGTGFSE